MATISREQIVKLENQAQSSFAAHVTLEARQS